MHFLTRYFIGSFNVGDVVVLSDSESEVKESFNAINYNWSNRMRNMLGKKHTVVAASKNGIIALRSPDGSQDGKWYFLASFLLLCFRYIIMKLSNG